MTGYTTNTNLRSGAIGNPLVNAKNLNNYAQNPRKNSYQNSNSQIPTQNIQRSHQPAYQPQSFQAPPGPMRPPNSHHY